MRRSLLCLLAVLPLFALAQKATHAIALSKDSLEYIYNFDEKWRFASGDDPAMATKDYNDSAWEAAEPDHHYFDHEEKTAKYFEGLRWWRLHILIDSTVTMPLALYLTHYGASEIFVD